MVLAKASLPQSDSAHTLNGALYRHRRQKVKCTRAIFCFVFCFVYALYQFCHLDIVTKVCYESLISESYDRKPGPAPALGTHFFAGFGCRPAPFTGIYRQGCQWQPLGCPNTDNGLSTYPRGLRSAPRSSVSSLFSARKARLRRTRRSSTTFRSRATWNGRCLARLTPLRVVHATGRTMISASLIAAFVPTGKANPRAAVTPELDRAKACGPIVPALHKRQLRSCMRESARGRSQRGVNSGPTRLSVCTCV